MKTSPGRLLQEAKLVPRKYWPHALAGAAVFSLCLAAFAALYLPVLRQTGGRAFVEVQDQTLPIAQIVNPGQANFVWGSLIERFPRLFDLNLLRETGRGWTPITFAIFLLAGFRSLRQGFFSRNATVSDQRAASVVLTVIVLSLAAARLGGAYPWQFVFDWLPGAKGIRVPGRINLMLNVGVVIICALEARRWFRLPAISSDPIRRITLTCLCALTLVEQWNWEVFPGYSRKEELAYFSRVRPPDSACRAFFVSKTAPNRLPYKGIDAMLVARQFDLPTLNGYSGFFPPGWSCPDTDEGCAVTMSGWAAEKGITAGLCSLDLESGTWSRVSATPTPPSRAGP